jgi:hypothetical protein
MSPGPSTLGQDPKTPQSWNLYPYVVSDPVNFSDPTGLFIQCTPPTVPSPDGSTCVAPDPGPPTNPLGPTTGSNNPDKTWPPSNRTCPKGFVLDPYGHCVTQQQCDQEATQLLANAKNSALNSFEKGFMIGAGVAIVGQAVAGCAAGAFAGSVLGVVAAEFLGMAVGGAIGCLDGAEVAVLAGLPQTLLFGIIGASTGYYSAVTNANNAFQQNWQNCGN